MFIWKPKTLPEFSLSDIIIFSGLSFNKIPVLYKYQKKELWVYYQVHNQR